MAGKTKRRKSKLGKSDTANPQAISNVSIAQPPAHPTVQAPQLAPEVRDEITSIMQQLLLKTHELSFEYSTLDCEEIQECPLAQKSKELFKVVKRLNEVMKQVAPPRKDSMIA